MEDFKLLVERYIDIQESCNKSGKGCMPKDFGDTPEERAMIKLTKKKKGTPAEDFGDTPEEKAMIKLTKKKASVHTKTGGADDDDDGFQASVVDNYDEFEDDVPHSKNCKCSKCKKKASVVDDHTNGRNGSVKTACKNTLKEEILGYAEF